MKKLVVISGMLVFFASCGKDVPVGDVSDINSSSIIVGDIEWKEVTELVSSDPKKVNSKAVADIQFTNGGRCTGFLISDDVLMTNEHCIGSASDVVGMKVYMKHEKGVRKSRWEEINCGVFMGNDAALDIALVKCSGSPGVQYGKVELDQSEVVDGSDIYVVHQNCDYYSDFDCDWSKKVSEGKVVGIEEDVFYDADTLGGSSGSPVFSDDNHKVVAIHHAGYGGGWTGRGIKNAGVPMSKIVPFIEANYPEVFASEDDSDDTDVPAPAPVEDNNDSFEDAEFMSSKNAEDAEIKEDDEDFYKAFVSKGQIMNFKIEFKHKEGDLDFKVYRKSGSRYVTVKSKVSATDDESVSLKASTTGYYYFKVYGYRGAQNKYKVSFSK